MKQDSDQDLNQEEIHPIQKLFDRPFLLLAAGMTVMAGFYTLWGIFEIMTMGKAPLP